MSKSLIGFVGLLAGAALIYALVFWGVIPGTPGRDELDDDHKDDPIDEGETGKITLTAERRAAAGIKTVTAVPRMMPVLLQTTGTIEPNDDQLAHVGPLVAGVVEEVTDQAQLGVHVEPGDTLAVLHSVEAGEAQSNFLKAFELVKLAEKTYAREKELAQKKISSGKELLKAESAWEQARIGLQATKAKLGTLGFGKDEITGLEKGKLEPDGRMRIVAPIKGTVIEKHLVKGEFVAPETSLFTVADLHSLWIQTHIYERDLARIKPGQDAELSVAAYPGVPFPGKVRYVGETMDEKTRTVKARVVIEDESHRLKPGMFVQVKITVGSGENVPSIPEAAVQAFRGWQVVFVEEEPNVFQVRRVVTGVRFGGFVEIKDGVNQKESVVYAGAFLLKSEMEKKSFKAGHAH